MSKKVLIPIIIGVFVLVISPFAFYFFQFNGELSHEHSTWGEFGDYFGGVLNPIFGFLSFIALLIALWFQQQEMKENRLEGQRKELAEKEERDLREILTFHQILNQNINYYMNLRNSFEKDHTSFPAGITEGAVVNRITGSEMTDINIKTFFHDCIERNWKKNEIIIPNDLRRLLYAIGSICEWLCDKETSIPVIEYRFFSKMITNILSEEEIILINLFINMTDGTRYISSITKVIDFVSMNRESITFRKAQKILGR
ncbi:hypothetical protein V6Z05_18040 [Leptospira venezuelensis]|uniref:hypothetical protein n=1 Tax=Leptospira venezuelensis TaxID=1958811 RepID=UPI000A363C61|nr:hypothetical protein [Leptospira venezuelensis]